jgi:cytochrome c oxidase subunit 2
MRRRPVRRARTLPLVLAGLALTLSGCVHNAKQDSLNPQSHYARTIYNLILPVFAIAGVVLVIVVGGTLLIAAKYRVPSDAEFSDEDMPPQIHGSFKLEVGWTVLPALILLAVGIATVVAVFNLAKVPPPQNPRIEVVAQQWWWEFRYDVNHDGKYNEIITANEMVIPEGTDIALRLYSRDVTHGFWIPELNGKRDVVPGHPSEFNIAADHPGEYYGQCTVFCGLSHGNMRMKVIVMTKPDYAKWLVQQQRPASNPTTALAKLGKAAFTACAGCHRINGQFTPKQPIDQVSDNAPNLTHLMSRTIFASGNFDLRKNTPKCRAQGIHYSIPDCVDEANLRAWLRDPPALLPMAADQVDNKYGSRRGMPNLNLSSQQIDQLVAYLETLK